MTMTISEQIKLLKRGTVELFTEAELTEKSVKELKHQASKLLEQEN